MSRSWGGSDFPVGINFILRDGLRAGEGGGRGVNISQDNFRNVCEQYITQAAASMLQAIFAAIVNSPQGYI